MKQKVVMIISLMFVGLLLSITSEAYQTADRFVFPINGYTDDGCLDWGVQIIYNEVLKSHVGDDYCVPIGTVVQAIGNGRVKFTHYDSTNTQIPKGWYGLVITEHTLLNGNVICSLYGHAEATEVAVGDNVTIGQKIGEIIEYPPSSDHIHFGIYNGAFGAPEGIYPSWAWGYVLPSNFPENYLDPVAFIEEVRYVGEYVDGWHSDEHAQPSQPFVDCYNQNGGRFTFGYPWNNGDGGAWVHEWPSGSSSQDTIFLQDFMTSDGHWYQLVLNQEMNEVFPVHNQILFFWHDNFGYLNYGEPTKNECWATDTFSLDKLTIQEFKKNGVVHYLGYNDRTGWSKEYDPYEFYKWEEPKFQHYQNLPDESSTVKAGNKSSVADKGIFAAGESDRIFTYDCESFSIDNKNYLAVANHYNMITDSHNINSIIYKWDNLLSLFIEFQIIPTHGAKNWKSFTINGEYYLIVANFDNDTSCNIDSIIYKWNGSIFVEFQTIPTYGATDWENFTIDGDTYLVLAGAINSIIYKWNGSIFVEFQTIYGYNFADVENFEIDGVIYLAIAISHIGTSNDIKSKIYKWDGSMFVEFQDILTYYARDWESFIIDDEIYLAVANYYYGGSHNINSVIYKWSGSSFIEFQAILTNGARDWKNFIVDDETYLIVANGHYCDSIIYKWDNLLSLFVEFQTIPTDYAYDWENFEINNRTYLAMANSDEAIGSKIYSTSNNPSHEEQMLIQQNEIIETTAIIPNNCAQAEFSRIIKGSDVEMSLIAPDETVIDRSVNDPNINHILTSVYESYEITNPLSGEWTIRLIGTDVSSEGEETTLVVSITPESNDPDPHPPIAYAGPDQTVAVGANCMASISLNGAGSSDPDGDPLTYMWIWNGNSANGVSPTIQLPLGITTITLVVNDGAVNSEPDEVNITVEDTTPPATQIISPVLSQALQDGVILTANASDACGVAEVYFYIREADGGNGSPIGYEDLLGTYNSVLWEYNFETNTPLTPDGYYVILTKAVDTNGNEGWSAPVPVSIRNWAVIELLPNTANNKAGRTMPVKFALRIATAVDPLQPFVYNQELEIKIYDASGAILQTSLYGDVSTDYRIDTARELYITNFKTSKKPAKYVVEIWRISKNFLIGSFAFETVK